MSSPRHRRRHRRRRGARPRRFFLAQVRHFDPRAAKRQQALAIGAHQALAHHRGEALQLRSQRVATLGIQRAVALHTGIGAHHAAREALKIHDGIQHRLYFAVKALWLLLVILSGLTDHFHDLIGGQKHRLPGIGLRGGICGEGQAREHRRDQYGQPVTH